MSMLKIISHRGNLAGSCPSLENKPSQVESALRHGYNVEIDLWRVKGDWFLGHDEPQYRVGHFFPWQKGLWCHCKNLAALDELLVREHNIHCNSDFFFHNTDSF